MDTHTLKEWGFIEREADDKSLLKSLKNTLKTHFGIKDLKKSLVKYSDIYYKQFSKIEKIIEYIGNNKKGVLLIMSYTEDFLSYTICQIENKWV